MVIADSNLPGSEAWEAFKQKHIEGLLSKTTRHHRLGNLRPRDPHLDGVRDQLMTSLGVTNSEGLL